MPPTTVTSARRARFVTPPRDTAGALRLRCPAACTRLVQRLTMMPAQDLEEGERVRLGEKLRLCRQARDLSAHRLGCADSAGRIADRPLVDEVLRQVDALPRVADRQSLELLAE